MLYDLQHDFETVFYFVRIILVWVLIYKGILWLSRNEIRSFNILFGSMYMIFLYYDMDAVRIIVATILCIINGLHILSK